jgi:phenylacetate-coenzyme A ligase PaaK-like adenylate-forming protein
VKSSPAAIAGPRQKTYATIKGMTVYSRLLQYALLPGYDVLRGYKHSRYRAFVEKSQWWSREDLVGFQWTELHKLLDHAFSSVPFYREKYGAAGARREDIQSWEDFAKLPAVTREEIDQHREKVRSEDYRGKLLPHSTGGSSGVPLRFYITRPSFEWRCAVSERAYSWTGVHLGERALYLWGAAVGAQPRRTELKLKVFRLARRELMFNTFSQSEELWKRIYEGARQWKPKLIVGYVSSLEGFCRWLISAGKACTLPSLQAAIAAAEPVFENTRLLVEKGLGIPLFNTYGSREFMSIAGECNLHDGLHINAENILLETETGSTQDITPVLVTDLHNLGMPFIRYRIGDLAVMSKGECACGRGLPRICSIEGRQLDALRAADGRIVPGEFFPHILKEVPEIREFQVRQEALDSIRILAVLSTDLSERSSDLLRSETAKVFGNGTKVTVERVARIPHLNSGKRRVTIGLNG